MSKKITAEELEKLIRKRIQESLKTLNENIFDDDDDNLGIYSGGFNSDEFHGAAQDAAMQDIGSEFEPLGSNKFEKNLNPNEFTADLQRQNLNLPNDRKEVGNIKRTLDKRYKHEKQFGTGSLNETEITRPIDAAGNPITIGVRVEGTDKILVGRVKRFGVDDENKLTVHINPVGTEEVVIKYPSDILVKDEARIVKEDELEETMSHSHANGRGQNLKPSNFPETLKRDEINENLDMANANNEVFLVVDNDFNRAHYKDLIGKTFEDAPGYAAVKIVKQSDVPTIAEDFDYAGAEIEQNNKEELSQYIGKKIVVLNKDKMENLIFGNNKRIQSIYTDLREELDKNHVQNNIVVASDNLDTQWIFKIIKIHDNTVSLEFTGTAK